MTDEVGRFVLQQMAGPNREIDDLRAACNEMESSPDARLRNLAKTAKTMLRCTLTVALWDGTPCWILRRQHESDSQPADGREALWRIANVDGRDATIGRLYEICDVPACHNPAHLIDLPATPIEAAPEELVPDGIFISDAELTRIGRGRNRSDAVAHILALVLQRWAGTTATTVLLDN